MTYSSDSDGDMAMFTEPAEFNPPPPEPTFERFLREKKGQEPSEFTLRLVGSHPLWGHHLWNAAKMFANWLDARPEYTHKKNVLELGAGAALPSLIATVNGASKVVITDYPDESLIKNIEYNVQQNVPKRMEDKTVVVEGYLWGKNTKPLLDHLNSTTSNGDRDLYDTIILSDLLFNHSQHRAMLKTCKETLRPKTGRVFVFFTHHRPWLAHADNKFFEIAAAPVIDPPAGDESSDDEHDLGGFGFKVEKVLEEKMLPMFPEDPGSEEVRATVHGYMMWLE